MTTTTVEIPMDIELNKQLTEVCHSIGMTVGGAFNLFALQMVQARGLPLEMKDHREEPNEETLKAITDIEAGRNVERFDSAEEALASLGLV